MFDTVELPVWALVLMGLLAAVTAASHFLFPSVRWFFRRRAEKVVARLNDRLTRPIEPFKLMQRHDMIQQILYDPQLIEAVNAHAKETGVPANVAFETAQRYAREIVPSFSASVYFGFGTRAARMLARTLYRVRVSNRNREAIDAIDPDATVVFIMNHRSNMDYVLVTYLVAGQSALSYAVGEWARGWPLQPLIKMMGGYFIRRKSRNPLYRQVLARYVQLATNEGVTQAVFPEGGLTRTGGLGAPKLGLLSYILETYETDPSRDVVFVPVGLNYDRVLEDQVLVAAAGRDNQRFKLRVWTAVQYISRHFWQRLTGSYHRLGFAAVTFGAPVSLAEFSASNPGKLTKALGLRLMDDVSKAVPVLPVPLVCWHLQHAGGRLGLADLKHAFGADALRLKDMGFEVCLPKVAPDKVVSDALNLLSLRELVQWDGDTVVVTEAGAPLIRYYAASIDHIAAQ